MVRAILICCVLTAACRPTPVCEPEETRCTDNVAEICGSDGVWRHNLECGYGWECRWYDGDDEVPAGHTCLEVPE
jgi:hypothetical protein